MINIFILVVVSAYSPKGKFEIPWGGGVHQCQYTSPRANLKFHGAIVKKSPPHKVWLSHYQNSAKYYKSWSSNYRVLLLNSCSSLEQLKKIIQVKKKIIMGNCSSYFDWQEKMATQKRKCWENCCGTCCSPFFDYEEKMAKQKRKFWENCCGCK